MCSSRPGPVPSVPCLALLALLGGCSIPDPKPHVIQGQGPTDEGLLNVVVSPGEGRSCGGSPCSVYYRVPDLGGPVEIVANNFSQGSFPSGAVVSLGQYNDSVRIMIKDRDVATAYVNIPRRD